MHRAPTFCLVLSAALLVTLLAGSWIMAPQRVRADDPAAGAKVVPVETNMHEFMEYVFQPTFRRLKPAMDPSHASEPAWKAIKSDSLILAETSNLLLLHTPPKIPGSGAKRVRPFATRPASSTSRHVKGISRPAARLTSKCSRAATPATSNSPAAGTYWRSSATAGRKTRCPLVRAAMCHVVFGASGAALAFACRRSASHDSAKKNTGVRKMPKRVTPIMPLKTAVPSD